MTKILIVDDNEQNLYYLKVILERNGYKTESAENGEEALELAHSELPDLVISDILMPTMDGFTFCRNWMADDKLKNVPFVVYTSMYTDSKDKDLALSLGVAKYMVKPLKPEEILNMVKSVLDESKNK